VNKTELLGLMIILILAIFLVVYTINPIGTISNDNNLNNPLIQLESLILDSFNPISSYRENASASLDSIGKISDGYWYINATAFAQYNTKYLAMYVTWYDSSGKVISDRKLVWNQSNLESQQSYTIHGVSYMKNKATPSKVKVSYFDDPSKTNNDSKAFQIEEINNGSSAWLG
jgi:hypothetical protein